VLISAYGLIDDWNPEIKAGYATTTVNRVLSDLTPLLDSEAGKRVVIGGDLNVGTHYTDPSPDEPHRWGPMHRASLGRVEALGLVDCLAQPSPPTAGRSSAAPAARRPTAATCAPIATTTGPTARPGRTTRSSPARRCRPASSLASRWIMRRLGH
jgi:hypothetical protein